ncbi:MAG: hypothetical protein ACVCEJ_10515 [Candidatus Izemoplasmataceae bacterium]
MKKLFLLLLFFVVIIGGIPLALVGFMYDGSGAEDIPTDLYSPITDAKSMFFEELDTSINDVEDGTTTDMEYNATADMINTFIFEKIRENPDLNPNYLPGDDCEEDSCNNILYESLEAGSNLSLRGVWVDLHEDEFIINIYLEAPIAGFSYKTTVRLYFSFEDLEDQYVLSFEKITLGNIPVPKTFLSTVMNLVSNNVPSFDVEELNNQVSVGDLDIETFTYTLLKDDVLEELVRNEDTSSTGGALAQEVLSIIYDNNLLEFKVKDDEIVIVAGISKLESTDAEQMPLYLYDLHDYQWVGSEKIYGDFNPDLFDGQQFLVNRFTEYVFTSALSNSGFMIYEETFNKLIYHAEDGFSDTRISYTYTTDVYSSEMKSVEFGLKALWFDFTGTEIIGKALFQIAGVESMLELTATQVSESSTELIFEFDMMTIGKDPLEVDGEYINITDMEPFIDLFRSMGSIEFASFNDQGQMVITAEGLSSFLQQGSTDAVEVTGIALVNNAIELQVSSPQYQALLDTFTDEVYNVVSDPSLLTNLDDVLDDENNPDEQALLDKMSEIQNDILVDGTASPEDINEMFTMLDSLDPETQVEFIEVIESMVDPTIFNDFDDIFSGE